MKSIKAKYFALKTGLILSALAILGFSACDEDNDIQPEYGVPVVRDKSVTQNTNQQATQDFDTIVNKSTK